LSCPDPSVVAAHVGHYRYCLACTSDYDANAYPIRGSNDLLHWRLLGHVFPAGHEPWWALPSPVGRYWAPAIYRIDGHWVVYFAAQYNAAALALRFPDGHPVQPGTFAIGVATANSITGPWHSRLLHYRGQDNSFGAEHENYGGVIDPSMVQDPRTGQRYLFWAEQHTSIWVAKLSPDGLTLEHHIHEALWTHKGWECRTPSGRCTIEGPEETYRDGWFYLFFSGASTWSGTYAVGAAVSTDPLRGQFKPLGDHPILRTGHGWLGPGGTSAPITGPNGRDYLLYHAMPRPDTSHTSADRYLFISRINWPGLAGANPLINDGLAGRPRATTFTDGRSGARP
jgi:arabinan endo-1,5-alpha-L-arabinosidase